MMAAAMTVVAMRIGNNLPFIFHRFGAADGFVRLKRLPGNTSGPAKAGVRQ
jgi:hypothetical protein